MLFDADYAKNYAGILYQCLFLMCPRECSQDLENCSVLKIRPPKCIFPGSITSISNLLPVSPGTFFIEFSDCEVKKPAMQKGLGVSPFELA